MRESGEVDGKRCCVPPDFVVGFEAPDFVTEAEPSDLSGCEGGRSKTDVGSAGRSAWSES